MVSFGELMRRGGIQKVAAPMVAQSDLAFRKLCRSYDTQLCFTQMIHARNFLQSEAFRRNHLDAYTTGTHEVEGWEGSGLATAYEEGGPLIVQLAGNEPEVVCDAAQMVLERTTSTNQDGSLFTAVNAIDLNLGCPQDIARRGRYGAFLLEHQPECVYAICSRLRQTLPSPQVGVTVKVRLSEFGPDVFMDRIRRLIDAGVDMITIHGRTLRQNKVNVGSAALQWPTIRTAVEVARSYSGDPHFPIVANGSIEYPSDVERCLEETGATAVMSSEALLENPGLFAASLGGENDERLLTPPQLFQRQLRYASEYLQLASRYPPLHGAQARNGGSFNVVRGHLFKFLYRYLEEQVDLRDAMASRRTRDLSHAWHILDELRNRYSGDTNWQEWQSSNLESSWYRRHRKGNLVMHTRRPPPSLQEDEEAYDDSQYLEKRKMEARRRIAQLREKRLAQEGNAMETASAV